MKRILGMILLSLLLFGCATEQADMKVTETIPRPANILDCEKPEGRRYVCNSDEECKEYLSGYSAVLTMKYSDPEDFYGLGESQTHPVIHVNLYWKHTQMLMLARWEAEQVEHPEGGMRWYVKTWMVIYDDDCKILHEEYAENFRKERQAYDEIDPDS